MMIIATLLALTLVLAACGGNNGEDSDGAAENTGGSEANMVADNSLDIEATNFKFDQKEYRVKAGEPVTINFKSSEGMHGIAIDEFDVDISGDGTAQFTPGDPGEYIIYCNIPCGQGHSDMKSTIIVE